MPADSRGGPSQKRETDDAATVFYRHVLRTLGDEGVPFLVGGAFAFAHFTGIQRYTKDLDLFILRDDYERIAEMLGRAGYRTELTFPHWLAKAHSADGFVDLIFNSGNGLLPVDEGWFAHATSAEVLDVPVKLAPAEEGLCSKAFIMERERYDGADVAHLIRSLGERMDWARLLGRFGPHWRVLLSHLVLFGYVYPGERDKVPCWVMDELLARLAEELQGAPPRTDLCAGTLLSREQYLHDIEQRGMRDARVTRLSTMTPSDIEEWTQAIASRQDPDD
jgi:predicted nucleotidyltransferase